MQNGTMCCNVEIYIYVCVCVCLCWCILYVYHVSMMLYHVNLWACIMYRFMFCYHVIYIHIYIYIPMDMLVCMCVYIYIYMYIYIYIVLPNIYKYHITWSKEVQKSNFRQYGQMEKQRWEESKKRKEEERRSEKRKKSQNNVFPMFCGSGGSKRKLVKVAGAKPSDVRTAFGSWDVEKVRSTAARSIFRSQNVENHHSGSIFGSAKHMWKWKRQNTTASEHFLKSRGWKIACRFGARHIFKSKW